MRTPALLLLATLSCSLAEAAGPIRVYIAGESIERRNRFVAPPFTATGALNERGGGDLRNDDDEYGWMIPMRDRLKLRAPDLDIEFVGSDVWADADDNTYSGTYPTSTAEPTSAISGTSIPSWLEQRRQELEARTFCYDLAFASRGGNDFGNENDDEYVAQLKELIRLLANGSSCRANPVIVVTGHMPDYQFGEPPDEALLATVKRRFVDRALRAVEEITAAQPALRVRFVDQYTPFVLNQPTTAFPAEVWSRRGVPDYEKILRQNDSYHPRRLACIYAGELAADGLDLAELRGLVGSGPVESSWLLPSSARAAGIGTFFTTDLTLRNTGTSATTATVKFLGHTGDGRSGAERTVPLAAGEAKTYADVLSSLFGLTTDFGPILVRSTGSLAIQGQTSTPGGTGGTFGQSVPAIPSADFIGAAQRSIVGVSQDAAFRTNLMLANATETPVEVDVVLVGPGGNTLATRRVEVGPLAFAQLNVANDLGVAEVSGAALLLSTSTAGGKFAAYASAIDRTTGDPRTLLPGSTSGSSWMLPSSARAAGIGTFFTTDLTLRNTGASPASAVVKFLGHTGDGTGGAERTVTLAAGETKTYADVLSSLFGLSTDFGPILVRSTASLAVQGQTSTPGGGGTFGQSVPAVPAADFIGATPKSIVGVSQDAAFRTNLMLANAGETAMEIDVVLVSPAGATLATRRVSMGPLAFAQLNVGNDLGIPDVTGAAFVLSTPTAGARFAAYASAIDRTTGDPRTLLPR
ncbi:MAG: SGNH/GDSL hydrolase family protein [Acidobacteria bacterium]|nr:SGNH/GDSL hydrolase family protein [Acidobacteriota bacterium]